MSAWVAIVGSFGWAIPLDALLMLGIWAIKNRRDA